MGSKVLYYLLLLVAELVTEAYYFYFIIWIQLFGLRLYADGPVFFYLIMFLSVLVGQHCFEAVS